MANRTPRLRGRRVLVLEDDFSQAFDLAERCRT
jgi:hypothetical protein